MNLNLKRFMSVSAIAATFAVSGASLAQATPSQNLPGVTPVASVQENNRAGQQFSTELGIATAVGGIGGTFVGAIAGCIVGAVVIPAIGCIPGIPIGAGVGGVIGTVVAGGGTLIGGGIQLAQTLNAAPGHSPVAQAGDPGFGK